MITIRSRLVLSFLLLVLLPAMAFTGLWLIAGLSNSRRQAIAQLESVATLKEAELATWAATLQTDLALALTGKETVADLRALLTAAPNGPTQGAYQRMHERLGDVVSQARRFDELFVMDLQGRVRLSTDRGREGRFGAPGSLRFLQEGQRKAYLHPPSYNLSLGGFAVTAVQPIRDEQGRPLGILAGRASLTRLNEIMLERTGLGATGETYLVTPSYIMLTAPRFRRPQWSDVTYVFSAGAEKAVAGKAGGTDTYSNYQQVPVIGVYRWLPELQVALLAEQAESEVKRPVYLTLTANAALALAVLALAGGLALLLARGIAGPLARLVGSAGQVAAGDLGHAADVERPDEIGDLAQAFNAMTRRLRELVGTLEQRVEDRTRTLEVRALQLETMACVSREITSILALEDLLLRVVDVIRVVFAYYHVAVYLVDERRSHLLFGAGSTEDGELTSSAEPHGPLAIGPGSLNGRVAQVNQALLVEDVAKDPHYLPDERLPLTRSELVVPLRIGERVVGTLDVQSRDIGAFGEDEVRLMQSLGDQVAVAIENARLYDRSRALAVVEERSRLARELHDSVTQSLYSLVLFAGAGQEAASGGQLLPVAQHLGRIEAIAQQAMCEMRLLLHELRPPTLAQQGLAGALLERLEAVERRVGIRAHLAVDGQRLNVSPGAEQELYCITLEALNNSLKHAGARSVTVRLQATGDWAELVVADDGRGFDVTGVQAAAAARSVGLSGMAERAQRLGGTLTIDSAPGSGTVVGLRFPWPEHSNLRANPRQPYGAEL